jgi:hypothetical protein
MDHLLEHRGDLIFRGNVRFAGDGVHAVALDLVHDLLRRVLTRHIIHGDIRTGGTQGERNAATYP